MTRFARLGLSFCCVLILATTLAAAEPFPGRSSDWRGYDRHDFPLEGRSVTVVVPKRVAAGKPWIWRARFFDYRPEVDLALLGEGYHVVFMEDNAEMLGSPECVAGWNALYRYVTETYGLAKKPALEGLSRGGLYVYNWAAANPDKVGCIYADAPVCDFKSWPGGKGKSKGDSNVWRAMMKSYGFKDEQEALAYTKNPIDNLKALADAKVPVLHVAGDADELVPYEENTGLLKQRYEALGGSIGVIIKKGFGHEHGLADPTPIVEFILQHTSSPEARQPVLKGIRRVVFLGDSITYGGDYIDDVDAYLFTRFPGRRFELLNLGLPSETTSGLSETGHAGGAFPRPNLHDRLARVLEKTKPDLVIACYGINDGIYLPFSEDRFAKYQDGIRRLVTAVTAAGAKIILLTPPPYDPVPVKSQSDYDRVLDRYSQWLLDQRQVGWTVVDVHGAMNRHLAARRQQDPGFTFARDGVHPDSFGHWLIAEQILLALGVPAEVDGAVVETGMLRTSRGHVTELVRNQDALSFTWTTLHPMATNPQWDAQSVQLERIADRFNRQRLAISGLSAPRYQLFGSDTLLGTFTREELGRGVDVLSLPNFPTNRRSADLFKLVHQRQRLLCDAWLTDVGHARPGMGKGVPLDQATRQAAELEGRIRALAGPVAIPLRLVPAVP